MNGRPRAKEGGARGKHGFPRELFGFVPVVPRADVDALKAKFYPTQTIETSKETLAWLQSKMPPGIGS